MMKTSFAELAISRAHSIHTHKREVRPAVRHTALITQCGRTHALGHACRSSTISSTVTIARLAARTASF